MKKTVVLLVFLLPQISLALGGYVGGGLGVADVSIKATNNNEDIYDPSSSIAGRVGLNFNDMFTLGFGINSWVSIAEDSLGNDNSVTVIPLLFEFNYYPMEGHSGFYIGVNAGIVQETVTITTFGGETEFSETETGYGGQLGWNFNLSQSKRHTLGGEFRYIHVDGDPQTYSFVAGLVMYNFWFGN